jgi:anti-anti-sigma factor
VPPLDNGALADIIGTSGFCVGSRRDFAAGAFPSHNLPSTHFQFQTIVIMASYQRIEVSESNSISVVRFKDQKIIDPESIQQLGQELFDLVENGKHKKLVVNFSNVEFLSSAALGKLITFEKLAKRHSAELILTDIAPEIFQVFAITNLDKLFQIKDNEADALAVL